ncbi:MAG: haloacid dehalogenase [Anaerolineae bacterium]
MDQLEPIMERIRADLTRRNEVRDLTLNRSRMLIRFCANSIRATHRHEFDLARRLWSEAKEAAEVMQNDARPFADIYYAGYLQDALKELAEAAITLALVSGEPLPDPDDLGIEYPAYLNGLAEAAGELRRYALDSLRRGSTDEAERLLGLMDDIYSELVTVDFPDALTGGLRRTTDMVRGVTERLRSDLTTIMRQEQLQAALQAFEQRFTAQIDDE